MNDRRAYEALFDVRRRVAREEVLETVVGGTAITGAGAANQVAVFSSATVVGGNSLFLYDGTSLFVGRTGDSAHVTSTSYIAARDILSAIATGGSSAQHRSICYGVTSAVAAQFSARAARGSEGTPAVVQNNDNILLLTGAAWDGSGSTFPTSGSVSLSMLAAETHSSTAHGTKILVRVTPIGTTSTIDTLTISDTGLFVSRTTNATTAAVDATITSIHASTGTPAAGFGSQFLFQLQSSTTVGRSAAGISALWTTATDASRTAALTFSTVNNAGSLTERVRIPGPGGLVIGTAAIATNATDGFLYLPTCAGTPTGTPTSPYSGFGAMVYDTTNLKLWIYSGSAWKGVVLS